MLIVSYGGGTNSTAALLWLEEQGIRPDYIHFSDTRGEHKHTYEMIEVMQDWCSKNGFPAIVILQNGGANESLYDNCMRRKALPSVAYGFKTCSQRWKIAPADVFYNNQEDMKALWRSGKKATRLIGFDADEPQRASELEYDKWINWYPLVDNDMGRDECVAIIKRHGLPQPLKSSCTFCPNLSVSEIKQLHALYPEDFARAVAMEDNADLDSVKGLGRNFSWKDVIATDDFFGYPQIEMPCGCYDG